MTLYEWTVMNVKILADAIIEDGGMNGPKAAGFLDHMQTLSGERTKSRKLLELHMKARGKLELIGVAMKT